MELKGKNIAVLGLGVEGLSSARFLAAKGGQVTVLDEKDEKDIDQDALRVVRKLGIKTVFGKDAFRTLTSFDMLLRSPGIRRSTKLLDDASGKGVTITSQTQLFLELCPAMVIGVTGTKGKGTTSSLVVEMLKKSGFTAYLGGNIGIAPFEFLDTLNPQDWVVLEMSSYQLQDIQRSPHIAVMLMVTSEHLIPDRVGSLQNYHPDVNDYVEAKRNILRFQKSGDFAILNRDYIPTNESDIHTDAKAFYVSRERPVDEGCFVRGNAVHMRMQGTEWEVVKTADIKLPGKHNLENVCAAVMAATLAGAEKSAIVSVLTSFTGLEHRLELVREVNGVKYYDDSFSTTPETAIAAIEAFSQPEILILGGSSKKSDFSELGKVITNAQNIKVIIGVGAEWPRIREQMANGKWQIVLIEGAKDMKTIVAAAAKIAQPGDVVLLTPACASFDMFKSYKDRGEQFKREVNALS